MNRLSSYRSIPQVCVSMALLYLAALPAPASSQKPAAAPRPASASSLALSPKEAAAQKQMLDADKRLDRPISLDVISVPLNEVLQQVSLKPKDSKEKADPNQLVLTSSHKCEDLKLQIRLKQRPLRVLMTALAEMLPGKWTRTDDGYMLAMTDKAVLARAEWWRLFLGEREKALAAQRQIILAAMETKARRRQADDPDPEHSDRAIDEEMANQHDFFYSLPEALKQQIAATLDDSGLYDVQHMQYGGGGEPFGTVGWLSQMSPETQDKFKTAMQDNITNHLASAPPQYQKYAQQAQQGLAALDTSKVYFLFMNGGVDVFAIPYNGPPSLRMPLLLGVPMTVEQVPLMLDETQLADIVYGGALTGAHWKQRANMLRQKGEPLMPEEKRLMYEVYGMGDAAPPEWKQLAAYQRGRVWPNLLPKLPPDDSLLREIVISRAAQTDWLGEQGKMEYVSDYYSHGGYSMPPEQRKLPVKRPLATELDEMAAKRDVSWKQTADGVYLIRSNRWYRDDGLEVPQPLLRRWFALLLQARQQEISAQATTAPVPQTLEEKADVIKQTWDWAAEASSALTPWQIHNGLSLFQPEERGLAPQNDSTVVKLNEKYKHRGPMRGETGPANIDPYILTIRRPPLAGMADLLNLHSHTVHLYANLDDAGRTSLLAGHLPVFALNTAQLTEAVSLVPLLPQALQNFSPDVVSLGLVSLWDPTSHIFFGNSGAVHLQVVTPQSDAPEAAAPP